MERDTETPEEKAPKGHDKHDPETTLDYCSHVQMQREPETEYDTEAHVTQPDTHDYDIITSASVISGRESTATQAILIILCCFIVAVAAIYKKEGAIMKKLALTLLTLLFMGQQPKMIQLLKKTTTWR